MSQIQKSLRPLFLGFLVQFTVSGIAPAQAAGTFKYKGICRAALAPEAPALQAVNHYLLKNDFQTGRNKEDYLVMFGEPLRAALRNGAKSWNDFGGGRGRALREFLAENPKAQATNITVEADVSQAYEPELRGYQLLTGRIVEDIPDSEVSPKEIGTDYYGALSYSKRPDLVLHKYNVWTTKNGATHALVLENVSATHKQDVVITKDGSALSLVDWIQKRSGLKVQVSLAEGIKSEPRFFNILTIQPVPGAKIPELELVNMLKGKPPARILREKGAQPELVAYKAQRVVDRYFNRLSGENTWLGKSAVVKEWGLQDDPGVIDTRMGFFRARDPFTYLRGMAKGQKPGTTISLVYEVGARGEGFDMHRQMVVFEPNGNRRDLFEYLNELQEYYPSKIEVKAAFSADKNRVLLSLVLHDPEVLEKLPLLQREFAFERGNSGKPVVFFSKIQPNRRADNQRGTSRP